MDLYVLRRVDALSVARVAGMLYAAIGLIFGALFSLFAVFTSATGVTNSPFSALFGVAAVVILPIVYGVFGLIMSFLGASLFNIVSGLVGGVAFQADRVLG